MTEHTAGAHQEGEPVEDSALFLSHPERNRLRVFAVKTIIALGGIGAVGVLLVNYAVDKLDDKKTEIQHELDDAKEAVGDVQKDLAGARNVFVDGACASIEELQRTQETGNDLVTRLDAIDATARQAGLIEDGTTTTTTPSPAAEPDELSLRYQRFVEACQKG